MSTEELIELIAEIETVLPTRRQVDKEAKATTIPMFVPAYGMGAMSVRIKVLKKLAEILKRENGNT